MSTASRLGEYNEMVVAGYISQALANLLAELIAGEITIADMASQDVDSQRVNTELLAISVHRFGFLELISPRRPGNASESALLCGFFIKLIPLSRSSSINRVADQLLNRPSPIR